MVCCGFVRGCRKRNSTHCRRARNNGFAVISGRLTNRQALSRRRLPAMCRATRHFRVPPQTPYRGSQERPSFLVEWPIFKRLVCFRCYFCSLCLTENTVNSFLSFQRGPKSPVTLQWATYRDAANECSLSRLFGGIHPPVDDMPGRRVGTKVAQAVVDRMDAHVLAFDAVRCNTLGRR